MNLVVDAMQKFSGKPLSYFRIAQKGRLLYLFKECLKYKPVSGHRKKLDQIYEFIESHNESRRLWRDSEVYYPLYFILHSRETQYFPYLIELLQLIVGIKSIDRTKNLPDGYYRLKNSHGEIFEIRGGRLSKITREILWKVPGFGPDIYLPRNGLFRDILEEEFYPHMRGNYDARAQKTRLQNTIKHLQGFSCDIWDDFQDAVWNIAMLTSTPDVGIGNMSIPPKYFGGIFFSTFRNDEYQGVENLVHEYIHQRCWLWWTTATPTGIPPADSYIVSPVTGCRIQTRTMIHAFIIYVNALHFYRSIQSGKMPKKRTLRKSIDQRASHLSRNLPLLHRRLSRSVKKKTGIGRLLDYLMGIYEPLSSER